MARIRNDFSLMAIVLIPIGVAINAAGGLLAKTLQLPVFLDSIGTFLVAMLAGPWVGAITGILGVAIISFSDPQVVVWCLVAGTMGVVVGFLSRARMFRGVGRIIASILVVVALSVLLSVIIRITVFGGIDAYGVSVIGAAFMEAGMPLWLAVTLSSVIAELPDKIISLLIPLLVIAAMSDRYLSRFSNGPIYMKNPRQAAASLEDVLAADAAGSTPTTAPGIPAGTAGPGTTAAATGTAAGAVAREDDRYGTSADGRDEDAYGSYDEPTDGTGRT